MACWLGVSRLGLRDCGARRIYGKDCAYS